ncbi:TlpA disulfide reductase family protein [Flavobacterium sp. NKUCC04_CG]|uniref:TlpA family protein disulfide reductase n=1 Tax=Flavobacterium sp. NKUCC04_CG TaxID=2842121 RepID=UPI001C5BF33F|nr:TlpA disulfide reductase family protein [Flavobacterium sp. NKUCC04_CG]MBW3520217.1 TlpA family protein disulfide reductase [Flavobacterium sp. NKUCC04_CG]
MKKLLLLFVAVTALVACSPKAEQHEFSKQALSEELIGLDGKKITFDEILKRHEGSTVVIDVWASWCPDCIKGFPSLTELQKQFPDVDYVFLSADKTQQTWKESIEKYNLQGDHYFITDGMKGNFGKSITLDWIPRYIVVDKTGKIALFKAIEADAHELITVLKKLK